MAPTKSTAALGAQEIKLLEAFRQLPKDAKTVLVKFAVGSAEFERVMAPRKTAS